MYSVFKVKEKNRRLYFYFQSIEELHEMYIWILKKYPKLLKEKKLEILKETKDKRVSKISGKYYNETSNIPDIGDWNVLKTSLTKRTFKKLEIFNGLKTDYFYIERKEFDHKKDGFSCICPEYNIEYNTGLLGLKKLYYNIRYDGLTSILGKRKEETPQRFDIDCNSLEELHDIYLYFLKLGYHTKILTESSDTNTIKRRKFKTTQKATVIHGFYMAYRVSIRISGDFMWFLKFWENFELLYNKLNYTFERIPIDEECRKSRFTWEKQKRLILNKKLNYGDII